MIPRDTAGRHRRSPSGPGCASRLRPPPCHPWSRPPERRHRLLAVVASPASQASRAVAEPCPAAAPATMPVFHESVAVEGGTRHARRRSLRPERHQSVYGAIAAVGLRRPPPKLGLRQASRGGKEGSTSGSQGAAAHRNRMLGRRGRAGRPGCSDPGRRSAPAAHPARRSLAAARSSALEASAGGRAWTLAGGSVPQQAGQPERPPGASTVPSTGRPAAAPAAPPHRGTRPARIGQNAFQMRPVSAKTARRWLESAEFGQRPPAAGPVRATAGPHRPPGPQPASGSSR